MLKSKNKLLHKALAFVLTFSLLATLVSFNFTASAEITGTGTAKDPYTIATSDDLKAFANSVNAGQSEYTNAYVKLADNSDITIADSWTPIGNADNKFTGVFDGNGQTITINITDGDYVGLFGVNEGTIKNVTVAGNISSSTAKAFVGGVAGLNRGTITNCTNSATISATGANSYAGGIAGVMQYGTIDTCTNSDTINVNVSSDTSSLDITDHEASAGGIVAFNYNGTVKKSTNTGNIENNDSHGYTGGIVGNNDGVIDNCLNSENATITNSNASSYVGGIAGNLFTNSDTGATSKISNTLNLNTNVNGIVGSNGISTKESTKGVIENSFYQISGDNDVTNNDGTTGVTNSTLMSGEVTYKLNGESVVNPVWGQTIEGNNTLPVIGASENTVVYPNTDNNGYTNNKPTACTDSHSYKNGVCTKCFDVAAKVAGYSVTLDGTIGLNFYFDIKNDIENKATQISYQKDKINGTAELNPASKQTNVASGYTRYVATVPVDSDQMNIDVVTTLQYDTTNNDSVVSKAYNVNKYLNTIYSDPSTYTEDGKDPNKLKTLVQTMSTYGYYANEYFDDYLPYEPSIPYYNLTVTANNLSDSKYDISYTGNGDGSLSHYASTLQYLEQVSGVFYVNNTNKISDIYMQYEIIGINGTSAPGTNTVIKPVVASNSIYTYAITDKVSIAELGQIKFAVTFGTMNDDTYTAKTNTKYYSPYTYIKNILTKYETANNTENLSYKLTQALYHYSEAANAYF